MDSDFDSVRLDPVDHVFIPLWVGIALSGGNTHERTGAGLTPSEKPCERQRARLIAGETGRNVAKRSRPNDPDPTDESMTCGL